MNSRKLSKKEYKQHLQGVCTKDEITKIITRIYGSLDQEQKILEVQNA